MLRFLSNTKELVPLKEVIVNFLDSKNLKYHLMPDEELIKINISGDSGNYNALIHFDEKLRTIQIRTSCPFLAKDTQKLKIAELLGRLNYQLLLGHFIQDFEDGEIIYKTMNLFVESNASIKSIDTLFYTNVCTMDSYLPALMAVNNGYTEPALVTI